MEVVYHKQHSTNYKYLETFKKGKLFKIQCEVTSFAHRDCDEKDNWHSSTSEISET
jgi:hypothetical protein